MNASRTTHPYTNAAANSLARIARVFYLLTFVSGATSFLVRSQLGFVAGLVAGACYIAVTVLFFYIFKPVSKKLSLISLAGCLIGPVGLFVRAASRINPLVLFGFYCLLIGYLIVHSTFLPRFLGVLMVLAGLGWLTFLSPELAKSLSRFNFLPGVVGEGALTVWLVLKGVDADRWQRQASASQQETTAIR